MKSISFISGSTFNSDRGMTLVVDRSAIPASMALGMWLDDDGKAFPGLPRTKSTDSRDEGEIEFLQATKVNVKFGSVQAAIDVAAGTKIELTPRSTLGDVQVTGATVAYRGARRFAQITANQAQFAIDKAPNAIHVFTIDAEKPSGAAPGARYRVVISQKATDGTVVGGITVLFTFDS